MGEALARRHDDAPFQLWDDLGCERLKDYLPIAQAAHEAHYKLAQRRAGVIPLSEFHLEGAHG